MIGDRPIDLEIDGGCTPENAAPSPAPAPMCSWPDQPPSRAGRGSIGRTSPRSAPPPRRRSACVPDGRLARLLGPAAVVAAVAALAILARALQRDEALSERVIWLAAIAAEGGALAAGVSTLALGLIPRGGRALRGVMAGLLTGLGFVPATLACFAIKIRILDGRIEGDLAEGIASGDIIFSLVGAMGMFTPTGLRYLAPWPIAAVTLAAGLLFWRWPAPRSLPETT